METKIEYQLTPELANQLILEETDLRIAGVIKHKWKSPILIGSVLAFFLFFQNYPFSGSLKIGDMDFSVGLNILLALLIIVLGFGLGFGGVLFFRKRVRARACEEARKRLAGSDAFRKIYWDDSTVAMATTVWETKVKWQIVEQIIQEKVGIHIYTYGRVLFSIPKSVLPVNLPPDELIRSWNSFRTQAKQIKP